MVGKVAKLDFNTNNGAQGWFASMTIYVNLDKPLVSQILINENIHRVEYEYMPSIYFLCDHYGHVKGVCTNTVSSSVADGRVLASRGIVMLTDMVLVESGGIEGSKVYGPWIMVERKQRRNSRTNIKKKVSNPGNEIINSRFNVLNSISGEENEKYLRGEDFVDSSIKKKGTLERCHTPKICGSKRLVK